MQSSQPECKTMLYKHNENDSPRNEVIFKAQIFKQTVTAIHFNRNNKYSGSSTLLKQRGEPSKS